MQLRLHVMVKLSDALCAHCRVVSPHSGENRWDRNTIPYDRVDDHPKLPAQEAGGEKECALCSLLRHALQDKYSDENTAEAENEISPSIRAN